MNLLILNGSPRGKTSNSTILMEYFTPGFLQNPENNVLMLYLAKKSEMQQAYQEFLRHDYIIFIMPLYCDAMPGIVMEFFESLQNLANKCHNKHLGFIVQSGFPESKQSDAVEKYFARLTQRLSAQYLGTIQRGGVEGIAIKPMFLKRSLLFKFYKLGVYFGNSFKFEPYLKQSLAKPHTFGFFRRNMFRFFMFTGLSNYYWNFQLKKYGVFANRFAKPYKD